MDKICPKCGSYVSGEDPKGNGVYIVYFCVECGEYIDED